MSGGRRAQAKRETAVRDYLDAFCLAYLRVLRRLLRRRATELPPGRSPCHTCALNPSTDDWPGMQATVLRLIDSVETGTPFVCHEGLPRDPKTRAWFIDWERGPIPPLCAGYKAIRRDPEAQRAPAAALREIGKPPKRFRLFVRRLTP